MAERTLSDQIRLIFKLMLEGAHQLSFDWLIQKLYRHQFGNLLKIKNRNTNINHFRFIDDDVDNVHFEKPSNNGNWHNTAGKMRCLASRFFLVEVSK